MGELADGRAELRELLAYPPETAGGLMTPAFVSMAPTLRADQAIAALRKVAETATMLLGRFCKLKLPDRGAIR